MKKIISWLFCVALLSLAAQITFDQAAPQDGGSYVLLRDGIWSHVTVEGEAVLVEPISTFPYTTALVGLQGKTTLKEPSFTRPAWCYPAADSLFVISDVHGQFCAMTELLQAQQVIDEQMNWQFGSGHLVVVGDVFDRGLEVNQTLWLLYRLEQQAAAAGGRMHLLLGNHEAMVLRGDDRYVRDELKGRAEMVVQSDYRQLYGDDTYLGLWLRSKNTIEQIGDLLFVHAGISPTLAERHLSTEFINDEVTRCLDLSRDEIKADSTFAMLLSSPGPVWYRGYFADPFTKDGVSEEQIRQITDELDVAAIVVGHTTQDSVLTLYDGRVLAVDAGLKRGKPTQGLLIKNKHRYRGLATGKRYEIK
jgi:hypothetical protein